MSICRAHTPGETNTCRPGCSVVDICCPLCSTTRIEVVDHDTEKVHFRVHPVRTMLINAAANFPPSLCFCIPCTFSVDDWELRSDSTANVQRRYCFHTTTSTFSNIDHFELGRMAFVRYDESIVNIYRVPMKSGTVDRAKLATTLREFYGKNPETFNKNASQSQSSKQSPSAHSQSSQPSREVHATKQQHKRLSSTPLPPALREMYPGLSDSAILEKLISGRAPTINSSTNAVRIQVTRTQPQTVNVSNPINTIHENNAGIRMDQAKYDGIAAPTFQCAGSGVPQTSGFFPSNHLESTYDSTSDTSNYFEAIFNRTTDQSRHTEAACDRTTDQSNHIGNEYGITTKYSEHFGTIHNEKAARSNRIETMYDTATDCQSSQKSELANNPSHMYDTPAFQLSPCSGPSYNNNASNIGHLWL